jgi:hypothetical protein
MICNIHQLILGYKIKDGGLGWTCGTSEGKEKYTQFWWGYVKERDSFEDLGADVK